MRDRYLFSADRKSSEYKHVLEITRGRARLLTPSGTGLGWRWGGSLAIWIGYLALTSPLVVFGLGAVQSLPAWLVWSYAIAAGVLWLGGLFLLSLLWDRKSLLFLADDPAGTAEVVLLGARSFGSFQDVRACTLSGEEFHLVVDARAPRFWAAVQLLEGRAGVSA